MSRSRPARGVWIEIKGLVATTDTIGGHAPQEEILLNHRNLRRISFVKI